MDGRTEHVGGVRQLQQQQQLHHQQVEEAQRQVEGLQSYPALQPPYSPLNLVRVKVENENTRTAQDYNQQAYNWLGYSQGLYGDEKSRVQNVGLANPYQNYNSQSWFQAAGHNYLDVDLSSYHNGFFQQPQSQPEKLSDGLQQLINLQQESIKKEPAQHRQQPSISSQYAVQAALLEQQQRQQQQQQQQQLLLQMQAERQQQFAPGLAHSSLEEDDEKPLSKWKTKTNKSRTTCVVCSAKATGWHYNVQACEGCKAFFKRSVTIKKLYKTCTVSFPDMELVSKYSI